MFRAENYIPKSIEIEHLDQEIKLLNDLEEEKRRYTVKLKALRFNPYLNPDTEKHYERRLKQLEKEIKEVELRLPKLQDEEFKKVKDLIQSVSGIGEKTSLQLMTLHRALRILIPQNPWSNILDWHPGFTNRERNLIRPESAELLKPISGVFCMSARGLQ
jgi:hypothetical protein